MELVKERELYSICCNSWLHVRERFIK